MGPIIVAATIGVGSNMIAEAGLSFLGLGAQSPTISWGSMLAEGQTFLASAPWVAFFPGAALLLAVLGINLLGRRAARPPGPPLARVTRGDAVGSTGCGSGLARMAPRRQGRVSPLLRD